MRDRARLAARASGPLKPMSPVKGDPMVSGNWADLQARGEMHLEKDQGSGA